MSGRREVRGESPTIIPKVQAVKNTLVSAVRVNRNMLRHKAVGLEKEEISEQILTSGQYEYTYLHSPW